MIRGKGYLKFSKSKDKTYVYLFGYVGEEKLKRNLYSFGRLEKALEHMYKIRDSSKLPTEISELGLTFDDLDEWIMSLETRTSRNGKKLKIPEPKESTCFEDITNFELLGMSNDELSKLNLYEITIMYENLVEMVIGTLSEIEELEDKLDMKE